MARGQTALGAAGLVAGSTLCLDDFAKAGPAAESLAFTMVSKKVSNCDEWVNDKHADYRPSFCFIGNLFINGRINNHPYFKSKNQYSNLQ
jgi:hypothetical protein